MSEKDDEITPEKLEDLRRWIGKLNDIGEQLEGCDSADRYAELTADLAAHHQTWSTLMPAEQGTSTTTSEAVENIAREPAESLASRLYAFERLARCDDDDERDQLLAELEVEPDDFEGLDVVRPLLADCLEFTVYRDTMNADRTIIQAVTTTGGPHVEWSRQSGDGASIVVVCYWGRHRHLEVVTVPTVAELLDDFTGGY